MTSTVSATSIFSTRSGLQTAEAELNAIAENLANPGLVSTQWSAPISYILIPPIAQNLANPGLVSTRWPAPSISYLRMPPLLDSPRLPLGDKIVLSQKQIDNILAIQTPLNLDLKRTGAEFTDFEREIGILHLLKLHPMAWRE